MKKVILLVSSILCLVILGSCGSEISKIGGENEDMKIGTAKRTKRERGKEDKYLVAYFSCTNNTKTVANRLAETLSADIHEIQPEENYTAADLEYNDPKSRSSIEQNDPNSRPKLSSQLNDVSQYDVIFLAYPIWWGSAPKVIYTFLESYDFTGKTIVPLCTSGGSGIGSSGEELENITNDQTNWLSGKRFDKNVSTKELKTWFSKLNIPKKTSQVTDISNFNLEYGKNGNASSITLNSGYKMPVAGIGTYSLENEECEDAILSALESGVRLIDTAYMYRNEEAVGNAIRKSGIPREEIFVITKIYPSQFDKANQAIDEAMEKLNIGYVDLMLLHHPGEGDVKAYKAMEKAVKDKKIRSIGLSNWYVEELEEFLPQVETTPALVQNEIHPYYQENDVIPYIQEKGIAVQGWYPLGGRGHTKELLTNKTIVSIAEKHKKSSAQVILRWNLQKGVVVIPGSSDPDHIRENISIFDFELSKDDMTRINQLNRDEKHDWY